jgi:septum formation topological specificity factor MinE
MSDWLDSQRQSKKSMREKLQLMINANRTQREGLNASEQQRLDKRLGNPMYSLSSTKLA